MESGAALVVMDRNAQLTTTEAAKFNAYLAEEGLDAVIRPTRAARPDGLARTENYQRFLKVLVQERDPSAASANTLYKRRVGERLKCCWKTIQATSAPMGNSA